MMKRNLFPLFPESLTPEDRRRSRRLPVLLGLLITAIFIGTAELYGQDVWASAYYAGWMQGWNGNGHLPAEDVDYSAVTHIIHFALLPGADGSLDADANTITTANSSELLTRAHAANKKVIISVGGWNSETGFRGATSVTNRALFISNLIMFMTSRGYDGIDIDWEPLQSSDSTLYRAFIVALRTALDAISPRPLLTAATGAGDSHIFTPLVNMFDQINLMTYDMSGAWPGWVTWHNAPIYDGGFRFPSTNGLVPSADGAIDEFIAAGIPRGKLGIGIDFYGKAWIKGKWEADTTDGLPHPRREFSSDPWPTVLGQYWPLAYYDITEDSSFGLHPDAQYFWDDSAAAAYIAIDSAGWAGDKFISYDNQQTVYAKFDYIRDKQIGGLIIWELGGGYRPNLPEGERDSLLQAVKAALYETPGASGTGYAPESFTLSQNYPNPFNPSTVIKYQLPGESHVTLEVYNTLGQRAASLVQGMQPPGEHGVLFDASALPSGVYFYRIMVYLLANGRARFVETKKMILAK